MAHQAFEPDESDITLLVAPKVWVAAPEVGTPFAKWGCAAEVFILVLPSLPTSTKLGIVRSYCLYT